MNIFYVEIMSSSDTISEELYAAMEKNAAKIFAKKMGAEAKYKTIRSNFLSLIYPGVYIFRVYVVEVK